jgi:ABC-type branched-subunit amino acid transport system substrate-binding protein
MRGKKLWVGCISVLLLALLAAPIIVGHCCAADKTLKIGTVDPISGPEGIVGLIWNRGFDLCADWLNEQGGVKIGADKYRIEFIHEDSKASPEGATAATNKLVFQDKVPVVMGDINNPNSEAVDSVTKPAGVLHVLTYSNDPYTEDQWGLGPDNPLMFLPMTTINLSWDPFFKYLHKHYPNVKRLVYAKGPGNYTKLLKQSIDAAEAAGFKVIGGSTLEYSWTDFYPFLTSLLKDKPDAIYFINGGGPGLMVVEFKAARELGFKGPIISFGGGSVTLLPSGLGAKNANDIISNQAYAAAPEATKMMKEVMKRWKAKYPKEEFVDDSLMAWDELWVLAMALEKAGSLKPEAVIKAVEGMTQRGSLNTTFGPGCMGGLKTLGTNRFLIRPIPVTVVQNGKIRMPEWVMPQLP